MLLVSKCYIYFNPELINIHQVSYIQSVIEFGLSRRRQKMAAVEQRRSAAVTGGEAELVAAAAAAIWRLCCEDYEKK